MKDNIFKVICINNIGSQLDINGIYNAEDHSSYSYIIYEDNGEINTYSKIRFKSLKQKTREDRIDKLIK